MERELVTCPGNASAEHLGQNANRAEGFKHTGSRVFPGPEMGKWLTPPPTPRHLWPQQGPWREGTGSGTAAHHPATRHPWEAPAKWRVCGRASLHGPELGAQLKMDKGSTAGDPGATAVSHTKSQSPVSLLRGSATAPGRTQGPEGSLDTQHP